MGSGMSAAPVTALMLGICVASIAAITDWSRGEIPNWLTLPPLFLAPLGYGLAMGVDFALRCVCAAILSAFVPYLLFRRGVMGGGDVKLLAALGATAGFDLAGGIEIQLIAILAAMFVCFAALAWKGLLLKTVANAVSQSINPILPVRWRRRPCAALHTQIRMGSAILFATVVFAMPQLRLAWKELLR